MCLSLNPVAARLQCVHKRSFTKSSAFLSDQPLWFISLQSLYIFLHQCIMDCLQTAERAEENLYENPYSLYDTELRVFHRNPWAQQDFQPCNCYIYFSYINFIWRTPLR